MVLVEDKKYACETCIKGHRSSTCNHTDRPLFEIKKKGRPVTQCEHCRELRKSKQVHVKCLCDGKADPDAIVSHSIPAKKANRLKGPTPSAAFPHGLTGVEGSITPPPSQSFAGKASRSSNEVPCTCPSGAPCTCCIYGKGKDRDKIGASNPQQGPGLTISPSNRKNLMSTAGGSSTRVRPIASRPPPLPLPEPASQPFSGSDSFLYSQSQRQNSPFSHGISTRPPHDAALYSHYGPPFDQAFASPRQGSPAAFSSQMMQSPSQSFVPDQTAQPLDLQWPMEGQSLNLFASLCECGEGCNCPGCVTHQGSSAMMTGTSPALSCANPGRCIACQNCAMDNFMLPGRFSFDPAQFQATDHWLSQLPSSSPSATSENAGIPSISTFLDGNSPASQGIGSSDMGMNFDIGFSGDLGSGQFDPFNFASGSFRTTLPNAPRAPSISAPASTTNSMQSLHVHMPPIASASMSVSRHRSFDPGSRAVQRQDFLSVMNPASTLSRTPSTGSASSKGSSGSDPGYEGFNAGGSSSAGRMQSPNKSSNQRTPYSTR